MPWGTIFRYTLSALIFAACACGLWAGARRLAGRRLSRRDLGTLAAVGYLAALVQIIGLRLGVRTPAPLSEAPNLLPLRTTLEQWRLGAGHFVYHAAGNLLWFVPLGLMTARRGGWLRALLAGAAVSAALEGAQLLLGTGMPDVDDVLLNALGALAGYGLHRLWRAFTTFNRRRA